jgi:hypothetical protein
MSRKLYFNEGLGLIFLCRRTSKLFQFNASWGLIVFKFVAFILIWGRRLTKLVQNRIWIGIRQMIFSQWSWKYCVFLRKCQLCYRLYSVRTKKSLVQKKTMPCGNLLDIFLWVMALGLMFLNTYHISRRYIW